MADYEFIEPTGVIVPDTSDTLSEVEQEWRDIFGADLVTSPETPQGAIITALAIGRDNTARNNAEVANQINPALASDIWLDTLCSLTGVQRNGATRSTIAGVKCTGVNGTVIPANSKIKSTNGDVFLTAQSVVIENNEAFVDVIAKEVGAIQVAPHALQTIAESVLGWETVDNVNAAVVGRLTESDEQLRARRRDRIARQSVGHNAAIIAALYDIPEVQSFTFRENYESTTETIDGVTLKPNSIYVCINGGLDVDIAKTLKRTKSLGCGYNGNESVTISDELTRQDYVVLFDRPSAIDVLVRVTIESTNVLADEIIKDAIVRMTRGEIKGDSELVIGRSVSAFEIAAAINFAEPSIFVKNVELSEDGSNWSSEIDITIQEIASIQESSIQVIEQ